MAAWLAEIKSRLLLPKAPELEDEEEGRPSRHPRSRRLQEYEALQAGGGAGQRPAEAGAEIFVAAAHARRILVP